MARNDPASRIRPAYVLDPQSPHLQESLRRALRYAGLNPVLGDPARRAIRQVQQRVGAEDAPGALRLIDQAWRTLPSDGGYLASIYGHLLVWGRRDTVAAHRLLVRAYEMRADADVAALIIWTALETDRLEDVGARLHPALVSHCIEPQSLMQRGANAALLHPHSPFTGWIGLGPGLEFVGALRRDDTAHSVHIQIARGGEFIQPIRTSPNEEVRTFSFRLPDSLRHAGLRFTVHGKPLLGGERHFPPDFALDGRSAASDGRVTGWASSSWRPSQPLAIRVTDDSGRSREGPTHSRYDSVGRWPFSVHLRSAGLTGARFHVSAQLPDGCWQRLPDSPVLLPSSMRPAGRSSTRLGRWTAASAPAGPVQTQRARRCAVVIPVYHGLDETRACLRSVIATVPAHTRIIVVNDASDDADLLAELTTLASTSRIELLHNPVNLGFAASVNRALALHPTQDVVVLNSDAQVFEGWLERMRRAAYSAPSVGSVTPFSNSGSIATYPHAPNQAIRPEQAAMFHAMAGELHAGQSVEIPVGVGFCLYLRRDCLRDVGDFDAAAFDQGYGEESDFCLRARARGWSHRLAADVFVYHAGGRSFGPRRTALLERGQRLLNLRHPGYDRFISDFIAHDPVHRLRRQLDEKRLNAIAGPGALIVTLALAGGVDRFVAERCRAVRAQGVRPLVLRPARAGDRGRCELWTDSMVLPDLHYRIPTEIDGITALLRSLSLQSVEIHHFLHLDSKVIEAVRALGLPYDVFVHDYAWVCPQITLIDPGKRYCGEPDVSACNVCLRRLGSQLGEKISVTALRLRSDSWLRNARRVIAPSSDTATRLQRYFPSLAIAVQPASSPASPPAHAVDVKGGRALRVALIGAIGQHKGSELLLRCARDARLRGLPIEFVVIGYTDRDRALQRTGKVFVSGRYAEAEVTHLFERERPDAVWMASVWPETWCYALDYALQAGLPVVAFDLGAIAERLRSVRRGTLLPLELSASQINDRLLQLCEETPAMKTPLRPDGKSMQDEGLSASVQLLPLPPGLYLFSVRAAKPSSTPAAGALSLPAVHVGLGPGVRAEQVEFMDGAGNHGAWLFQQGDLLIGKIHGSGATLVLTSVRAPGGEVLSIKVERLEDRASAPESALAANSEPARPEVPVPAPAAMAAAPPAPAVSAHVPMHIAAHIRSRGDVNFTDAPWAGRVAPGLWIESFSVLPMHQFQAQDIEYKALTGSGFETPWLSDNRMCGTRGLSVPLVGFAVRLKPSAEAALYDCEYSGYFQSGQIVGPLRNGAPCRSTAANDPLEGIQVHLIKRAELTRAKEASPRRRTTSSGPSFGRFRDVPEQTKSARRKSSRHPRP